jgi:hypothetical protein
MRLFGDGKHGHAERIQTFRCQACRTTFTARRNTPLYRLKTPSHQIAMVRISRWPKGWILRLPSVSSAFDKPPSRAFLSRAARARANPARALLLPSPPPASPVGRTAHQATLRQTGAVALAGHRPLHEDSSRAPSGSPHTKHGTPAHPLPATALGP